MGKQNSEDALLYKRTIDTSAWPHIRIQIQDSIPLATRPEAAAQTGSSDERYHCFVVLVALYSTCYTLYHGTKGLCAP